MSTLPSPQRSRQMVVLGGMLIAAATAIAYSNSFRGVFILDDLPAVLDIDTTIYPLRHYLRGFYIAGERWTVTASLHLNWLLDHSRAPFGYHVFNLLVHIAASLAVFGWVRRTFLTPRLADRFGAQSTQIALLIALIFALHPLQTQSVTYIIQRAQSMMGLFEIFAFYCIVRAEQSRLRWPWHLAALLSLVFALDAKPHMIGAPILVLLYDRTFLHRSFRDIGRRQAFLYAGILYIWLVNVGKLAQYLPQTDIGGRGANPEAEAGQMTMMDYALSQFQVLCHYLKLSIWPDSLCLDYVWPITRAPEDILPYAMIIVPLGLATVYGMVRFSVWGFMGAWFFINIGPSSSFVARPDLCVEHRMYVPLLGVICFVVMAIYEADIFGRSFWRRTAIGDFDVRFGVRPGVALALIAVILLGQRTYLRNDDYSSAKRMWANVVEQRPNSPRAHNNLGLEYRSEGSLDQAEAEFRAALAINPKYWQSLYNMGLLLDWNRQRYDEAEVFYNKTLAVYPTYTSAIDRLAIVMNALGLKSRAAGDLVEAERRLRRSIELAPKEWPAHFNLGLVLAQGEKYAPAIEQYEIAESKTSGNKEINDQCAFAENKLAEQFAAAKQWEKAIVHAQNAIRRYPGYKAAMNTLAQATKMNVEADADLRTRADQAMQLTADADPQKRWDAAVAVNNLGLRLRGQEKLAAAEEKFRAAIVIDKGFWPAYYNLGLVLSQAGRYPDAIAQFDTVEKLNPRNKENTEQHAFAECKLAEQTAAAGQWDAAAIHALKALNLYPNYQAAMDVLARAKKNGAALPASTPGTTR